MVVSMSSCPKSQQWLDERGATSCPQCRQPSSTHTHSAMRRVDDTRLTAIPSALQNPSRSDLAASVQSPMSVPVARGPEAARGTSSSHHRGARRSSADVEHISGDSDEEGYTRSDEEADEDPTGAQTPESQREASPDTEERALLASGRGEGQEESESDDEEDSPIVPFPS